MKANFITEKSQTDWQRVEAMTDEDIDFSDCPELDDEFFENALLCVPDGTYRDELGHVITREEGYQ